MGKPCAVPKCKTGYKSVKEKRSVFTAPKNIEQFKKWQAAIPGNNLRQSQCVCEKHFEEKCILKEWVKRDSEGRIIANVRYIHPRLVESAVPTIFDNSTTSVPTVTDAEPTDGVLDRSNFLEGQCGSVEEPRMGTPDAECAHTSRAMTQGAILDRDMLPHEIVDIGVLPKLESMQSEEFYSPQESVQHEVLPVTEVASAASTSENQGVADSVSVVRDKNFLVSKITIDDSTSNVTTSEKNPITIPTSWGVTEYAEARGQTVVFSNIVRTHANGTAITIVDKIVEVEADKTLRYCVYGRVVDSDRSQLPPVLTNTTLLPKTLETFKKLNVCQGLGPVNIHHLPVDRCFQDSVQRWRDNDCTMLSKQKRCDNCKKMRQRTLRRESRSDKTESIRRIRHLSNPIDRRKLVALRKKISREKRANNYLKRRVQLLTESLKAKAKEISSVRAEALDEKFAQLQVPASQQTALKEIISAAMRRDTKSRRYSEDWIMLCILMHIRSPSYYEFLRKNDVLPLPCTRTIHSYFSLIDVKCGFDEQFGQFLKKHFDKN